jgi:hypothetical protein
MRESKKEKGRSAALLTKIEPLLPVSSLPLLRAVVSG